MIASIKIDIFKGSHCNLIYIKCKHIPVFLAQTVKNYFCLMISNTYDLNKAFDFFLHRKKLVI